VLLIAVAYLVITSAATVQAATQQRNNATVQIALSDAVNGTIVQPDMPSDKLVTLKQYGEPAAKQSPTRRNGAKRGRKNRHHFGHQFWVIGDAYGSSTAAAGAPLSQAAMATRGATPGVRLVSTSVDIASEHFRSDLTVEERALFTLINDARSSKGVPVLAIDTNLNALARAHSKDMADRHYFSHATPAPGSQTPMAQYMASLKRPPSFAMMGQNIYYRSVTDLPKSTQTQANNAFLKSPGHRANMLGVNFTKVGVGFFRNAAGEYWVTEIFLRDTKL
jgi:uncharacterized protein YkwD